MQRYQLGQYQSTYRDPGSVAVNTQLRQQFAQAFAADDALAAAVDGMQSASFTGDQEAKRRLENSTREALEERASRGDYESMGMDVTKSVRAFEKGYQPIKTNLANVQAYKKRLQESYDKGDIDAETKNAMMAYSTHDYNGLAYDENGALREDSYFKGRDFVKDVNISEMFDERMKDIIMEKNINSTGEYITRQDPATGSVEYYVETEYGYEKMSPERIKGIFDDMMQDPNVQAAMAQKAKLRTYSISDEDLESRLMTSLMGDAEDPKSTGLQGALAEAQEKLDKAKGKNQIAAAKNQVETIQSMIEQYQEVISNDGKTPEEAAAQRRAFAQELAVQSEYQRELGAAYDKFEVFNVTANSQKARYSELHVAKVNAAYKDNVSNLQVPLSDNQVDNRGGFSIESINTYIKGEQDLINSAVEDFNQLEVVTSLFGGNAGNYTVEDIMSGNVHESLKTAMQGDRPAIADLQDIIKQHRREIDMQRQMLKQARQETGYTNEQATSLISKTDGAQEAIDIVKGVVPGISDIEAVELLTNWRSGDATLAALERNRMVAGSEDYKYMYNNREVYNKLNEAFGTEEVKGRLLADATRSLSDKTFGNNRSLNSIITDFYKFKKEGTEKANTYLEKNAKRVVSGFGSTLFPGETEESRQKVTKEFRNFFVGKSVPPGFNLGYAGRTNANPGDPDYEVGTLDNFRQTIGAYSNRKKYNRSSREAWRNGDIVVQDVLFNSSPGPGSGAITLIVKNQKGDTEQLHITEDQFRNKSVGRHFNSPQWRAKTAANRAENQGLDFYSFKLGNGLGTIDYNFVATGSDYVKFTKPITDPKSGETIMDTKVIKTDSEEFSRTLDVLNTIPGALPF